MSIDSMGLQPFSVFLEQAREEAADGDVEEPNFGGMAELVQMARRRIRGLTQERVMRMKPHPAPQSFEDMMEQATGHLNAALMGLARGVVFAEQQADPQANVADEVQP